MRHLLFAFPLFLLSFAQDSGFEYKFVVVDAEPVALNASDMIPVKSFEECIEKCQEDFSCVLAYQANSSDPCYLFAWNSIQQVTKNESGGVGTVAFKVYTDQPTCELNMDYLLNGKTYPLLPNVTTHDLWRIDTAETGWTITYIGEVVPDIAICGNFSSVDRPYKDSCDSQCRVTMVQIRAIPGPNTGSVNTYENVTNWNDCLWLCYFNKGCFTAQFYKDKCTWYSIGSITFWNRTEASEGSIMAIKLPLSNKTCNLTTEQLLHGQYYLAYDVLQWSVIRSFFQIQTTPKYYKALKYLDENLAYRTWPAGCEERYFNSIDSRTPGEPKMCYTLHSRPNLTQSAAKEICQEMGAELVTERYQGFFSPCIFSTYTRSAVAWIPQVYSDYGIPGTAPGGSGAELWVGLERDNATQEYKWPNPEFAMVKGYTQYKCFNGPDDKVWLNQTFVMNSIPYTWAPGQPDRSPGMDCVYMVLSPRPGTLFARFVYPGYALYTSRCDVPRTAGFICATKTQADKRIPKYESINAEYGNIEPPMGQGPNTDVYQATVAEVPKFY